MGLHAVAKAAYLGVGKVASESRLSDYKWFAEQEVDTWSNWVDLPPSRRQWLWRRGFTSPCELLYDFDAYGWRTYLSELGRYRFYRAVNGRHRYLVDDKLSQHWMMAEYPECRPTAYGVVDRGHVHGVAGSVGVDGSVPISEWLPAALRERSTLVLKHLRGAGGKQVMVPSYDDGFLLDGEPVTEAELCETVEGLSGYLVTEYVEQADYADALYPHAANTIRLMTLWDDLAGELLTPIAIHRIGTRRSGRVDNWSSGGLSAAIDLETGEMGPATQFPFSGTLQWYSTHPDTGARIAGTEVPNWEAVRGTVERIARDNTNVPAIGWDVLVDESGEPTVIEANTGSDVDVLQVHRPMLADPRVAELVARHVDGGDGVALRAEATVEPPTVRA